MIIIHIGFRLTYIVEYQGFNITRTRPMTRIATPITTIVTL